MRRWTFTVLLGAALARLILVSAHQGVGVVAPLIGRVLAIALAAWSVHVVAHETGHWVAAWLNDFNVRRVRFGPLVFEPPTRRLSWTGRDLGGGVTSFPRRVDRLAQRLRRVAFAGPLSTACLTLVTAFVWAWHGRPGLPSAEAIALAMGLLTLVTALAPSSVLPSAPPGGTDLEQMFAGRRLLAHWTHAAVLQGLSEGHPVSSLIARARLDELVEGEGVTSPLALIDLIHRLESGQHRDLRARLDLARRRCPPDAPDWLVADMALISGCFAALIEHDLPLARTELTVVQERQAAPWFSLLLQAAIDQAAGNPSDALRRWQQGLEDLPHRTLALTANGWVLSRLVAS